MPDKPQNPRLLQKGHSKIAFWGLFLSRREMRGCGETDCKPGVELRTRGEEGVAGVMGVGEDAIDVYGVFIAGELENTTRSNVIVEEEEEECI